MRIDPTRSYTVLKCCGQHGADANPPFFPLSLLLPITLEERSLGGMPQASHLPKDHSRAAPCALLSVLGSCLPGWDCVTRYFISFGVTRSPQGDTPRKRLGQHSHWSPCATPKYLESFLLWESMREVAIGNHIMRWSLKTVGETNGSGLVWLLV